MQHLQPSVRISPLVGTARKHGVPVVFDNGAFQFLLGILVLFGVEVAETSGVVLPLLALNARLSLG